MVVIGKIIVSIVLLLGVVDIYNSSSPLAFIFMFVITVIIVLLMILDE